MNLKITKLKINQNQNEYKMNNSSKIKKLNYKKLKCNKSNFKLNFKFKKIKMSLKWIFNEILEN